MSTIYKKGSKNYKNNKMISYLIVLISLCILTFFTRGIYSTLIENIDLKDTTAINLEKTREDFNKGLTQIDGFDISDPSIDKYLEIFSEDDMISYIYDYVEGIRTGSGIVNVVKNISFSEGVNNELGFREGSVQINLMIENEKEMLDMINYLVGDKSRYNFYIDNFSFPNDGRQGPLNIQIPLKILYK